MREQHKQHLPASCPGPVRVAEARLEAVEAPRTNRVQVWRRFAAEYASAQRADFDHIHDDDLPERSVVFVEQVDRDVVFRGPVLPIPACSSP